jgi:hypothetical protein
MMSTQVPPEVLDKYNYLQHVATEGPEQAASHQTYKPYTYPSDASEEESWLQSVPRSAWAIVGAVVGLVMIVGLVARAARERQASRQAFPQSLVYQIQQALKQLSRQLPTPVKDRLPGNLKHALG